MPNARSRRCAAAGRARSPPSSTALTSIATSTITRAITGSSTRVTTVSTRPRAPRRRPSPEVGARALVFVLGWTTFAFAGLYPSTLLVPATVCILLVIAYRPLSYGAEPIPAIDLWMAVLVAGIVFQMIPLPAPVIDTISPADRRITEQLALRVPSSLPISLDLTRTGRALLVSLGAILIFLTARRLFATGG